MLDYKEVEQENTQTSVLCGKSEKIIMDISSQDLTVDFNFAECEKAANKQKTEPAKNEAADISKYLLVHEGSLALKEQENTVKKELAVFKSENSDLADDKRFSDTYYFRLAAFYSLLKEYEKEAECLSKIQNKENPAYASRIAQNKIARTEHTQENLLILYNLNTAETARKLSGWYLSKNDFVNAEKALCHYIDEHDEIPYEIYFQYAFLFMKKGDAAKAIHYLRASFYMQNTAQAALALSMLYLVLATKKHSLLQKALYWCNIAVHLDLSFTPALRLYINLNLEKDPEKTERILSRYLNLNTARKDGFYFDAAINHAKCSFVKEKYGEALERLSSLIEDGTNPAAVWNNIALCNAGIRKYERAERNIAKSLEKFNEQKNFKNEKEKSKQMEIILTNYMKILNAQGKYKETISLFENTNGAKGFELSEDNYLNYFAEYRKALLATGDYETYFNFLNPVFMLDSTSLTLKLFACNDLLRLLTLTAQNPALVYKCLEFLKNLHKNYPHGNHTVQVINNIIYTSLELGESIPQALLNDFIPTIPLHPCNTATYGLYLIKIKHNIERGLSYYDKAIAMAQKDPKSADLTEELNTKKEIETAKYLIQTGDFSSAKRLLERLNKRSGKTPQGFQQTIARLLSEC